MDDDTGHHEIEHHVLDRVLSHTELEIVQYVLKMNEDNIAPTATQIQDGMKHALKKSQLYEKLNRLGELGFFAVREFPRPRKYHANNSTIHQGLKNWLLQQKKYIDTRSQEIEKLHQRLIEVEGNQIKELLDLLRLSRLET